MQTILAFLIPRIKKNCSNYCEIINEKLMVNSFCIKMIKMKNNLQ